MSCCNILTLILAALTSYFIIYRIPTTPSGEELMRIQKRRQLLKLRPACTKEKRTKEKCTKEKCTKEGRHDIPRPSDVP